MTKDYELMVIISPKLNTEEADAANESILNLIRENAGEIIKTDPWGRRILAYPIEKMQEGYYYVNYFKLDTGAVKSLKRLMNINDNVMRHMFIARGE